MQYAFGDVIDTHLATLRADVEDLARASEARLESRVVQLSRATREDFEREVFESLVQRLAAMERTAERHAISAVEALGERLSVSIEETVREQRQRIQDAEREARERLLSLAQELASRASKVEPTG